MNCLMTAWHANEGKLRGWLRHRLGNPVDAEDMLQDLFIEAMRQGERFCAIGNARAWQKAEPAGSQVRGPTRSQAAAQTAHASLSGAPRRGRRGE
jgi:predicted RNA polymerase sigma factor